MPRTHSHDPAPHPAKATRVRASPSNAGAPTRLHRPPLALRSGSETHSGLHKAASAFTVVLLPCFQGREQSHDGVSGDGIVGHSLVRGGVLSLQAVVGLALEQEAVLPVIALVLAWLAPVRAQDVAAWSPAACADAERLARMPSECACAAPLFQWKGVLQQSVCCTVSCSSPRLHTTHGLVEVIPYSASSELVLVSRT